MRFKRRAASKDFGDPSGLRPGTGQLSGDVTQDDLRADNQPDSLPGSGSGNDELGSRTGGDDEGGRGSTGQDAGPVVDVGGTGSELPGKSGERHSGARPEDSGGASGAARQPGETQSGTNRWDALKVSGGDGARPDGALQLDQQKLQVEYRTRSNAPFQVGTLVPNPLLEASSRAKQQAIECLISLELLMWKNRGVSNYVFGKWMSVQKYS